MRLLHQDAWSNSQGHVSLDSQQDYELIEAVQKPDGYYLLFKRPFSTCDPRDYLIEVCKVFLPQCVCSCQGSRMWPTALCMHLSSTVMMKILCSNLTLVKVKSSIQIILKLFDIKRSLESKLQAKVSSTL